MPLQIDGRTPGEIRVARDDGTLATVGEARVWDGRWKTVYTSIETVVITATSGTQARDQLRAALSARGLDYRTVTELPFLLDVSEATNLGGMFWGCTALREVPAMDTAHITHMGSMFSECEALVTIPPLDTSSLFNAAYMFEGCTALTSVPDMQTSNLTNAKHMFDNTPELRNGEVRLIGMHPEVTTTNMIRGSGLTREPFYTPDGSPIDVWEPRTVTIRSSGMYLGGGWDTGSINGDTSLIHSSSNSGISFVEKTTCDQDLSGYSAGSTIPARTTVGPSVDFTGRTFTFTSVR